MAAADFNSVQLKSTFAKLALCMYTLWFFFAYLQKDSQRPALCRLHIIQVTTGRGLNTSDVSRGVVPSGMQTIQQTIRENVLISNIIFLFFIIGFYVLF